MLHAGRGSSPGKHRTIPVTTRLDPSFQPHRTKASSHQSIIDVVLDFSDHGTRMVAANTSHICVVDDDFSVRESLQGWLKSLGYVAETFDSAEAFLRADHFDRIDCLILAVRMTGMTGLDLQRELRSRGSKIPHIFITAHGAENVREQALHEGAVAVLDKPFDESVLLDAIRTALTGKSPAQE